MSTQISLAERLANLELQIFGGPNVDGEVSETDIPGLLSDVEALQTNPAAVFNKRIRVQLSDINTPSTLLPAVTGYKYRLIDCTLIAIGGAAGGSTAVVVTATQAAGSVSLISAAIAALGQSVVVKPNTANVTVLANGASFVPNDVTTGFAIGKTGGTLTTLTHVDVILTYTLEAA